MNKLDSEYKRDCTHFKCNFESLHRPLSARHTSPLVTHCLWTLMNIHLLFHAVVAHPATNREPDGSFSAVAAPMFATKYSLSTWYIALRSYDYVLRDFGVICSDLLRRLGKAKNSLQGKELLVNFPNGRQTHVAIFHNCSWNCVSVLGMSKKFQRSRQDWEF